MQRWRNVAALAVLVLLPTLPAVASTFVAMTPGELIAHSDAVVVGDVIHVESFRDPSGRAIVTQAMIRVEETLTGSSPTVAVVQTFGGTVDSYTVVAHGFPTFTEGDRLVVFLEEHADGIAEVVGYRLGQYRVITNRFGQEIAVPTLEKNVSLLRPEGGEAVRPQAMPLSTLKTLIRREAQRLHRSF
jgi:hypothetical protein